MPPSPQHARMQGAGSGEVRGLVAFRRCDELHGSAAAPLQRCGRPRPAGMTAPMRWQLRLLLAALAGLLGAVASHREWLQVPDQALYDHYTGTWGYPADASLLLVAIDEASLQRLGPLPWPHATHARLLDRLSEAGTRRVALNLPMAATDPRDASQDALLAAAVGRNGQVVLLVAVAPATGERNAEELLPAPIIAASAAAMAHGDISVDSDGIVRSAWLHAGLGSPHWPALGLALADPVLPPDSLPAARRSGTGSSQWNRDDPVRLRYAGPPGSIARVAYADVLQGRVDAALLHGRRVIVGITAEGAGVQLLTPTSPRWMSSSEYQANLASMLLQQRSVQALAWPWQDGLSALLLALCAVTLCGRQRCHGAIIIAVVVAPLLSFVLLRMANLWWAPSAVTAGGMLLVLAVAAWWLLHRRQSRQHDPVTGVATRAYLYTALQCEHATAQRNGQPLALALIEIDTPAPPPHADPIAVTGPELAALAGQLRAHVRRPRDLIARMGTAKFALLLPDTPADGARQVVQDLLADLHLQPDSMAPAGTTRITLSIGVHCRVPCADTAPCQWMQAADAALAQARANGGDSYVLDADPSSALC